MYDQKAPFWPPLAGCRDLYDTAVAVFGPSLSAAYDL